MRLRQTCTSMKSIQSALVSHDIPAGMLGLRVFSGLEVLLEVGNEGQ